MVTHKELIFTTVWLGDGNLLGIDLQDSLTWGNGNLQEIDLYDDSLNGWW